MINKLAAMVVLAVAVAGCDADSDVCEDSRTTHSAASTTVHVPTGPVAAPVVHPTQDVVEAAVFAWHHMVSVAGDGSPECTERYASSALEGESDGTCPSSVDSVPVIGCCVHTTDEETDAVCEYGASTAWHGDCRNFDDERGEQHWTYEVPGGATEVPVTWRHLVRPDASGASYRCEEWDFDDAAINGDAVEGVCPDSLDVGTIIGCCIVTGDEGIHAVCNYDPTYDWQADCTGATAAWSDVIPQ